EELVGVEFPAPVAVPGPLDGRDAGLGEPRAQVILEPGGELLLGPAPQFPGQADVIGHDLVEVDLGAGIGRPGPLLRLRRLLTAAAWHEPHPTLPSVCEATVSALWT